ncbi:MAG TPA: ribosome-binding factor A [Candidatus Paceibacterota bacterium]|nr:ribosome-binding factor A [Candidatus Paceibacterota bacterium]
MDPQEPASRTDKLAAAIAHAAAQYFERESNRQSLITVTRADISPDLANATIYLSVLPRSAEADVISFARRNRGELREFVKKSQPMKRVPTLDVVIDEGEKHRQRIDDLMRE